MREGYELIKREREVRMEQRKYKFSNGFGASVIRGLYTYGGEDGLWELAVLGSDGHLTYTTPITDDVLGYLDDAGVDAILAKIEALPKEETK